MQTPVLPDPSRSLPDFLDNSGLDVREGHFGLWLPSDKSACEVSRGSWSTHDLGPDEQLVTAHFPVLGLSILFPTPLTSSKKCSWSTAGHAIFLPAELANVEPLFVDGCYHFGGPQSS